MSDYDADYQMLLQEMATEFLEESSDRLEHVEGCIGNIVKGVGHKAENILEIKRDIHGIKGAATPFGFPTISQICHALESFIEASDSIEVIKPEDLLAYVDAIASIVQECREPDAKEKEMLLKSLPTGRSQSGSKAAYVGACILIMPKNLQRKIISQELSQLGLKLALETDPVAAINTAIDMRPEYIVTSMVNDRLSGPEIAHIFRSIRRLDNTKIAIFSSGAKDEGAMDLPSACSIIKKGPDFAHAVLTFFDMIKRA
ncbi:MAG: Hpt domain-containing protein [Rhodospirillales bacterium]